MSARVLRAARAGFTMVELLISLAIAGIVLGAAYKLLLSNQRFYRSQSVIQDIQTNVREAALILAGELREISSSGHDLQAFSDTSVTINAMRALAFQCALPNQVAGTITVQANSAFYYRGVDPTRDSVYIFREGRQTANSDDSWLRGKVRTASAGVCTNGQTGILITLNGLVGGGFTQMDSVFVGNPVRTFETVNYRLFQDASGTWWLGVRGWVNGAWTTTSPVAGPLRPRDGINLTYYDSTGTVTAVDSLVRTIQVIVRGQSTQQVQTAGRPTGLYSDSLQITVALRNN